MNKNPVPFNEIPELTDERILELGNRIVATSMVPTIWKHITGHEYDRSAALHARLEGRIAPMGKHKNRLYFWTHEIEASSPPQNQQKRGRKRKQNDEISSLQENHQKPLDNSSK